MPVNPTIRGSQHRVRLTGRVAGVDACEIVSDRGRITVGSAASCDLCVADPLMPARAFTIQRADRGSTAGDAGALQWIIQSAAGSRVYVNDDLVHREFLVSGDTIDVGCHRFRFQEDVDRVRQFKSMTDVGDVCARLLEEKPIPPGYLHGTPGWQSQRRLRWAAGVAGGILLAVLAVIWLTPREVYFEQIQPPMEVTMVSERSMVPEPSAVRSMKDVQRRAVNVAADQIPSPELATRPVTAPPPQAEPDMRPLPETAMPSPPAPTVAPASVTTAGDLAPVVPDKPDDARVAVARPVQRVVSSAPARRLSIREATDPVLTRELAQRQVQIATQHMPVVAVVRMNSRATEQVTPPPTNVVLRSDPNRLAALMKYEASDLTFEKVSGARVPIARMPGKLAEMEVKGKDSSLALDGMVSDSEISQSWKSGQFRIHGPNPQPAQPPTYCYVNKTLRNGQECLYVSFICEDPDVSRLVSGSSTGVWKDDSVELFLDTNGDRRDYYHMIVNCLGKYQSSYCANGEDGINNRGTPWSAQAEIKTVVSPESKRWTGEILIPFAALGGKPAPGARWSVNFTRAFRGQGNPGSVYQNWFLVYNGREPNYHNPELFGVFQW